jgi:hypothetical protein
MSVGGADRCGGDSAAKASEAAAKADAAARADKAKAAEKTQCKTASAPQKSSQLKDYHKDTFSPAKKAEKTAAKAPNTIQSPRSLPAGYHGPGLYVAGRDLAGMAFVGTHQYVVAVPENPSRFSNHIRDLGQGVQGFVVGAFNENGRLQVDFNNAADLQATRELFDPANVSPFKADFDAEIKPVERQPGISWDDAISDLIGRAENYRHNEALPGRELSYPSMGVGRASALNSNSWAQSIIENIQGIVRPADGFDDFHGIDPRHENRIPGSYFEPPEKR